MNTTENNRGFTMFSHDLLNGILMSDLNLRELKIVFLVLRLTKGCHNYGARIKQADLKIIGIGAQHAKKVIEPMISKGMILEHEKTKRFKVNEEFFMEFIFTKENENERLVRLIGKHLPKRTNYQNGNTNVPQVGSIGLPKEEVKTYQNGNPYPLPKKEDSGSRSGGFHDMKDMLNTRIKISDR